MRRWISYLMLVIAVAFLASVPAIRSCEERQTLNPKYHAALYWAHIDAVDAATKQHVDFEITWDFDERSPFIKGSAPAVVETLSDGSKVVMIVSEFSDAPFVVAVKASGFHSKGVPLKSMRSGILKESHDTALEVIALNRIGSKSAGEAAPE